MFFAGLDLSRKRLDVHIVDVAGRTVLETAAPPDADGLRGLVERVEPLGPVRAAMMSSPWGRSPGWRGRQGPPRSSTSIRAGQA